MDRAEEAIPLLLQGGYLFISEQPGGRHEAVLDGVNHDSDKSSRTIPSLAT